MHQQVIYRMLEIHKEMLTKTTAGRSPAHAADRSARLTAASRTTADEIFEDLDVTFMTEEIFCVSLSNENRTPPFKDDFRIVIIL